jgi:alpha-beta hydrolase superfamily lysophospholipase
VSAVLYLHGFASSPQGRKVAALEAILAPEGVMIDAPDLNVPSFERLDFDAMVDRARESARDRPPDAVAGSSLGALVALALARHFPAVQLVLIAPALGFGRRWIEKLPPGDPVPFFHYGANREIPIHRKFFAGMAGRSVEAAPPAAPVAVVMGARDESVPIDAVRGVWERWKDSGALDPRSRFVELPGGDHGLTGFVGDIAAEIRLALGKVRPGAPPPDGLPPTR